MLLKNHSLFLNPSEEESKRIEKIDSFDGITENVFNKTLVEIFEDILCKKELKRISGDLQIVTIPGLNKANDYVDHHNDYINVIKNKLQYILEIYDIDNIEMKANAITEAFGSINNFIQISNFLDSDIFRNKFEKEADYILYNADNPKTAKEIEKFEKMYNTFIAKKIAVKNYNSVRIIKELLVLAVISKLERKIKRLKKKAETREKTFKGACEIFNITTNILPKLFRGIKVINTAHNFFENPAAEMVLDNNDYFNTILMEYLEAQDKIKTSKQTESENTENYKIDPNLIYRTFLIEMKNKKGIKLPKNFQSTFALLVNNFIEKYKSYKTPDIVSEELLEKALKDTKEILNNGNYLFSDSYLNKLKAQEKLLVLKTEEIEFKTNKINCTNNVQEFDALDINLLKRELNDLKEKLEYKHSCKKYYNYFAQLNITLGNALKNLIHKNKAEEAAPKFTDGTLKAKATSDNFSTEKVEEKQKPIHEIQVENLISGISKMLTQFQRDIRPLEYVEDDPITMFEITEKLELIKQNSDTEINNFIKEINDLKNEKHKIKKLTKLADISDDCVKYLSRLVTSCPDMEEKLFNCNKYLNKLDFEEITNDFDSTTIPKIREDFMTQAEIQFNYQLNKSGVEYNRKVIVFYLDQALELNKIVRELV